MQAVEIQAAPVAPVVKRGFIYKLCCADNAVTDIYVGSTNRLIPRKSLHKTRCINPNDTHHNLYVYQHIREHGGWDNWSMVVVEQLDYEFKHQLLTRERHHIEVLRATLNCHKRPIIHEDERKGIKAAQDREYRDNNVEQCKARGIKYREEHKEELNAKARLYALDHADERKAYLKQYYLDNREALNAANRIYNKQYGQDNKEAIAARMKAHNAAKKNMQPCACGSTINVGSGSAINKHNRSKKHLAWMELEA